MRPDFLICDDHVKSHAGKFAQKTSPCPACGKINAIFLTPGEPIPASLLLGRAAAQNGHG